MPENLIELAIKIQQVASPTFQESERAHYTADLLRVHQDTLIDIEESEDGNVYARYPGKESTHPLVISAHLDTVFPIETSLEIRREDGRIYGPGLGDNSLSVACLIAIVEDLKARKATPAQDIWLVANTGEEGLGDLKGMKKVVERFGSAPSLYLVLEGLGIDRLIHHGIGVKRYRISAQSSGGHSWGDFGKPSAIHDIAKLISEIAKISVPSEPKTTFNVGRIQGGTSINSIAAEASIELDLRSISSGQLAVLDQKVIALVKDANQNGCQISMETIGERPSGLLPLEHPRLQYAADCLSQSGLEPVFVASSTDANVPLSKGYPSFVMGITRGGGTHTTKEYIDTADIATGFGNIVKVILRASSCI